MNIALCGMMGVGKTSVGIALAKLLGRTWYDTDHVIEDKYGKISDLFEYYGEAHFRNLESEVTQDLSQRDHVVISTGGGLVLRSENSAALKKKGYIVFLRASYETILSRVIANDQRPLLRYGMEQKVRQLMRDRYPVYEDVADFVVDTDDKSVEEVANAVAEWMATKREKKKV